MNQKQAFDESVGPRNINYMTDTIDEDTTQMIRACHGRGTKQSKQANQSTAYMLAHMETLKYSLHPPS